MLEQILAKIQKKGWNAYEIEAVEKATNKTVEYGPAQSLVVGKLYVLFPRVADPTSLGQIQEALHKLEKQRPFPYVQYHDRVLSIPYLSLQEKQLLIRQQEKVEIGVRYEDFCHSLDSLNLAPLPN
ncbi:MAG: hypothetical protein AABX13_01920 [Nanoarchaeota archaeon]